MQVNNRVSMKIKIPRRILDKLTVEEALEIVKAEPSYPKVFRGSTIIDVKLLSKIGQFHSIPYIHYVVLSLKSLYNC